MVKLNLLDLIYYVDIGVDANTDLARWAKSNQNVFRLDILGARASATDSYFQRIEKSGSRTVFKRHSSLTFIIAGDELVQYQVLEAILEETIRQFFETYGAICCDILGGLTNMFEGFALKIPMIFDSVQEERIIWVRAECKICKENHNVAIKKKIVTEAKKFSCCVCLSAPRPWHSDLP